MHLTLYRYGSDHDSTGGALSVDGKFLCHTVEDEYRAKKVFGETRIPAGRYEIKLRVAGGMHTRYAQRFDFHQGMLHLQGVPGFEWIYIHMGKNDDHSAGCLLVGYTARSKNGFGLARSEEAYTSLYLQILSAMRAGEEVYITIIDGDSKWTLSYRDLKSLPRGWP